MRTLLVAISILLSQVSMAGMWCHKGTGDMCEYGDGHRLPDGAHYWTDTECVDIFKVRNRHAWKHTGLTTTELLTIFTGVFEEITRKILEQQKEIDVLKNKVHIRICPRCEATEQRIYKTPDTDIFKGWPIRKNNLNCTVDHGENGCPGYPDR